MYDSEMASWRHEKTPRKRPQFGLGVSPKDSYVEDFVLSQWCYWELIKYAVEWKELEVLGTCL